MKTFDNKQLAATRSMSELQATKRQITRRLRRTERHMADQYREATEMFSLRTVLTYGISLIDSVQSMVRYFGKGLFNGIASAIRRRHDRPTRAGNPTGDGE